MTITNDNGKHFPTVIIVTDGFKVTTDKGVIVIDYRNASNGYYGGSLSWPGEATFIASSDG